MKGNTPDDTHHAKSGTGTFGITKTSVFQITLTAALFISISVIQRFVPVYLNVILAQVQVLISVFLVTQIPRYGYYAAVVLNTLSSINIGIAVALTGSTQVLTGMIVPLVSIIIVTLIESTNKRLHYTNDQITLQRNEIAETKREADKANRAKSDFLSSMSHEIRTPLNSIIGYIELLSLTELDETQKKHLATVTTNAQNLLGIINDILDFSKIEQDKFILGEEAFQPVDAIQKVIRLFNLRAEAKQILLFFNHDSPPACVSDQLRFVQVLTNLVGNAMKFTPSGGRITVDLTHETSEKGVTLNVSVTDTGIGIPPDKIKVIFNPFEQSDAGIPGKYGGTGLGLSISAYIIRAMGGDISVKSVPGEGSCFHFTVTLPESGPIAETERNTAAAAKKLGSYKLHALVAEDTPDSLELITAMLRKLGITSDPSTNGREALELFKQNRYDVVILDGFMPEMDGNEAARRMREYESGNNLARTPIIALSAKVLKSEIEEFLRSGFDVFVPKPVTFPALEEALRNAKRVTAPVEPARNHSDTERQPFISQVASFLGVPEDIVETMLVKFTETTLRESLEEIRAAFNPFDSDRLVRAAHKLKGSSLSLMLKEISDECATLELLARNHLVTEAKNTADKIETAASKISGFISGNNAR